MKSPLPRRPLKLQSKATSTLEHLEQHAEKQEKGPVYRFRAASAVGLGTRLTDINTSAQQAISLTLIRD